MTASAAIVAILIALLLGAMSPGPSFVLVARNAIGLSRGDGFATAVGMGVGGIVFSIVALAGLYSMLAAVGWLYAAFKLAGGAYLLYLAWGIWRGAKTPISVGTSRGDIRTHLGKSFARGLMTQLSNPKTAVVFGSIFVSLLPKQPPGWAYLVLPPCVFAIEAGWYTVVALCFSSRRPRDLYLRFKGGIDRLAACAIAGLGLRLILTIGGKSVDRV